MNLFDTLSISELQEIPSKTPRINHHVTTRQRLVKHGAKDQINDDLYHLKITSKRVCIVNWYQHSILNVKPL